MRHLFNVFVVPGFAGLSMVHINPPPVQYGISQGSHMVLLVSFLCFVLGGALSVIGVSADDSAKWLGGLFIMIMGIVIYTCTIMYASVYGPPSGFDLKGVVKSSFCCLCFF